MELLEFADAAAWESWLAEHHADTPEAWLRIGKRGSAVATLAVGDALDVALCWGWIDGQRRRYDEGSFAQRYCPRRPRSMWSQVNVAKVAALTAAGRMRPPGLAQVAAAQADGRWAAAYASQRTAEVPPDLAAALAANPRAAAAFAGLGRSEQYQVILTVLKIRTEPGRRQAVSRVIARLERPDGGDAPTGRSRNPRASRTQ
jgi:uncharacterized protein YdeI (YjbR/CyaY-like superfamily)